MSRAVAVALLLAVGMAASAAAHDSHAPDGAVHNWLPKEDWVYRHWSPFDEASLQERLQLPGRELEAFLSNDHRTLAYRARRLGIDTGDLARELVAPAAGRVSPAQLEILRGRALRVLTQGHLAQHLFFHVYHGIDLRTNALATFGLSPDAYYAARRRGVTPRQAAAAGGRSDADVRAAMEAAFAEDHDEGLRLEVADPRAQATLLARRRSQLACWLGRPLPVFDRGHPYGDRFKLHGPHTARYPATPRERRRDDARVEFEILGLARSCWSVAGAWRDPDRLTRRAVLRQLARLRRRAPASTAAADLFCAVSAA